MGLDEGPAELALRLSSGLVSLLGLGLVAGGGLGLLEVGGGLRSGAGGGLGLFEVGGGLGLAAGGGSAVGVGACCAKEPPSTPIAGDDALVISCGGWASGRREGADVAGDSIGTGVEEPGGNSNGGSGGKAGALVGGGAAKRSPPPTTVPGSVEWIGSSMSAIAAARPAARMTTMLS
jgi:hypothetical protein